MFQKIGREVFVQISATGAGYMVKCDKYVCYS